MEQLVQQAAEALGYPAEMVVRSARARAAADGVSEEAVLAGWVGGEVPVAGAASAAAAAPAAPAPAERAPEAAPEPTGPAVEELPPLAEREAEPEPEVEEPEPEPVPAGGVPRWLAAVFVIVPVVAILYALYLPNGPGCGDGGVLAIDPVTGQAVNCDGSEYGSTEVDFFALGQVLYAQCSACHGADGGGGSQFPALAGGEVLITFPEGQCLDQAEWVALGTLGWPEPTYGATEKPVGGSGAQMPAFGTSLTEEELRAVVLYERVAFGGQDEAAAVTDCGLDAEAETVAAG